MFDFLLSFFMDNIWPWVASSGLKVLAVVVIAKFAIILIEIAITKAIKKMVVPSRFVSVEAEKKREDTLIRIFTSAVKVIVWIVTALMIISEFGFEIGPFLAAAGVVGLAFGFGGQYLIKDLISGFFLIMENQYRIGDVVCFDKICGSVEDISMRMTTLRDMDGTVHHVPHGEIKTVSNMSKVFARINLDIGVSYSCDLEKVISVINDTGLEFARDKNWEDKIIKPPVFLRVEDFADSAVILKIFGETKPNLQWEVTGELRKRIKIAFDKNEIEIPFPQMVVHK